MSIDVTPTTPQDVSQSPPTNGSQRSPLGRGLASIIHDKASPAVEAAKAAEAIPRLVSALLDVPAPYRQTVIESALRLVSIHQQEQGESVEAIGERLFALAREREDSAKAKTRRGWFGRKEGR
jgi:hypothetical protein